jgi:hypothetical protein
MVQRCAGPVQERPQVAVILDLENVLYDARRVSGEAVRAAFVALMAELRMLGDVRFAVGCCDQWLAGMLAPVAQAWGVRLHPCAIGPDCADRELLRRAADIPRGASVLVVASGDGAFAPLVAEQSLEGRQTVVIARRGHIAMALRCAAHKVRELTTDLRIDQATRQYQRSE